MVLKNMICWYRLIYLEDEDEDATGPDMKNKMNGSDAWAGMDDAWDARREERGEQEGS